MVWRKKLSFGEKSGKFWRKKWYGYSLIPARPCTSSWPASALHCDPCPTAPPTPAHLTTAPKPPSPHHRTPLSPRHASAARHRSNTPPPPPDARFPRMPPPLALATRPRHTPLLHRPAVPHTHPLRPCRSPRPLSSAASRRRTPLPHAPSTRTRYTPDDMLATRQTDGPLPNPPAAHPTPACHSRPPARHRRSAPPLASPRLTASLPVPQAKPRSSTRQK